MSDPPRLFESDPVVRDAIEGARADVPDAKRLAKIAAGATAAAAVTTAATASATASATVSATALKIVGAVVFVGAAVGVGVAVTHTSAPSNVVPSATVTASTSVSVPTNVTASASATVSATASASASTPATVSVPTPPPEDEWKLVDEAQKSLATDPQKALSLCDRDAKANPRGDMAQEREVIAIDALMRLSRPSEARARAAKFHATWPDSAHGRRVDALVELH